MTFVLYTEETPFCVFVREIEPRLRPYIDGKEVNAAFVSMDYLKGRDMVTEHGKRIPYHPRPGSADAIGCWSLLSDAGWRERLHPVDGGPADVCRDHVTVTKLMAELWDRTSGGQFFLGEWHSHPRNPNTPSLLDIDTAMASARDGDGNCPEFIMVISGHDGISVHIVSAKGTVTKLQKSTEPSPIAKASEVSG